MRAFRVDVVVSPVETTMLGSPQAGAGYPVVMGDINLTRLLQLLRPKVCTTSFALSIHHFRSYIMFNTPFSVCKVGPCVKVDPPLVCMPHPNSYIFFYRTTASAR